MSQVPENYPHSAERYAADVQRANEAIRRGVGREGHPEIREPKIDYVWERCPDCGSAWSMAKGDKINAAAKLQSHRTISCIARREVSHA